MVYLSQNALKNGASNKNFKLLVKIKDKQTQISKDFKRNLRLDLIKAVDKADKDGRKTYEL